MADLEHFDRPGLDTICLSQRDPDWPESKQLELARRGFAETGDKHGSGRIRPPLVYYSDVHSSPRQTVRTHEPSRASTYDEDVYVGLGGHGDGLGNGDSQLMIPPLL